MCIAKSGQGKENVPTTVIESVLDSIWPCRFDGWRWYTSSGAVYSLLAT